MAEHFSCFTAKKNITRTAKRQVHATASAIWGLFADLNSHLYPKRPDKDALSI